jgi:hypothetical protein
MQDIEKRLNARMTAQSLMIEALLNAAIKAGQLDVCALVESLEQFVESPKARFADPVEVEAVKSEVDGWADMVFDRYSPPREIAPERSRI